MLQQFIRVLEDYKIVQYTYILRVLLQIFKGITLESLKNIRNKAPIKTNPRQTLQGQTLKEQTLVRQTPERQTIKDKPFKANPYRKVNPN